MLFSFTWERGSYELAEQELTPEERPRLVAGPSVAHYVRRVGDRGESYKPLECSGIYRRLADTDKTPEGALDFTSRWGFLTARELDDYPVVSFYRLVDSLRYAVDLADSGEWDELATAFEASATGRRTGLGLGCTSVLLRKNADTERPTFALRPGSLISAIWIQFAFDSAQGANLNSCARPGCDEWFRYGPGTGRRKTARYCSPRCQNAHKYMRRKGA